MAAAREQAEERRLERIRLEVERGDVAVEVVDRDERQPARPGDGLRGGKADEERADQARALRHGDAVDVLERRVRLGERLADHRRHELEVPPRGDLGHDAAVAGVQLRLRGDDARKDLSVLRDDRRRRFVTRGLDPEDHLLDLAWTDTRKHASARRHFPKCKDWFSSTSLRGRAICLSRAVISMQGRSGRPQCEALSSRSPNRRSCSRASSNGFSRRWDVVATAPRSAPFVAANSAEKPDAAASLARGVRVEGEVPGVRHGLGPAGGRGDHRRVVGAEGERRRGRVGERRPQRRVRGDAADDRDLRSRPVCSAASRTRSTSARTIACW